MIERLDADVAVVGAGPAGTAAVLHAHDAGLSVVWLEKRAGVLDKACGEGLMPAGLAALARLGVDPPGADIVGIRYLAGERAVAARFADGPGRGVRRTTLQASMRERAAHCGLSPSTAVVTGVRQRADSVTLTMGVPPGATTLRTRYVIAADGLHSPLRQMLGLVQPARGPRRFGQRRHYGVAPWTDHVEVHWSPRSEAYVTPVSEQSVGVAVLSTHRESFDTHLRDFPRLARQLESGAKERTTRVLGAGPLRQRSTHRVHGRVLLVGDASGYVDALTGEGIALGLAHAEAAVSAIAADQPSTYEAAWRRVSWRYALMTRSLVAGTTSPWGRRMLVPAAQRLPVVFSLAVNELGRCR